MHPLIKRLSLVAAAALLSSQAVKANELLQITVTTNPLVSDTSDAPFYLDFQWNYSNSSGSTDSTGVDNTVTLSNFSFGGGSAGSAGTIFESGPNVSGNIGSSVTLNDEASPGFNEFYQQFTPGSTLTFDVSVPTSGQPGLDPEEFAFAILNGSLNNMSTTAPDASDSLVEVSVPNSPNNTNAAPTVNSYRLNSPSNVVATATAIPEPGSYACMGIGAVALLVLGRKVRRSHS